MQQYTVVLAAIGSVLVVVGGYHFLVAAPAMRRLAGIVGTHGELLGGGTSATALIDDLRSRLTAVEGDCTSQGSRVATIERTLHAEMPRIGFVRYNAFDDVGSDLSYALALLTRDGNGVVLSSIYSREETRTYGKAVENFQTAQDASSEEKTAIAKARAS